MKPLREQLDFYRAYHRTPGCKATHFAGVPLVTFSILIALGRAAVYLGDFRLSGAMVFVVLTLGYYFRLSAPLATVMTVVMVPVTYAADTVSRLPFSVGGTVFSGCLAAGIGFQAWGHVLERRKPALMDNFFQAVFTAPLFLLVEARDALAGEKNRAAGKS